MNNYWIAGAGVCQKRSLRSTAEPTGGGGFADDVRRKGFRLQHDDHVHADADAVGDLLRAQSTSHDPAPVAAALETADPAGFLLSVPVIFG